MLTKKPAVAQDFKRVSDALTNDSLINLILGAVRISITVRRVFLLPVVDISISLASLSFLSCLGSRGRQKEVVGVI